MQAVLHPAMLHKHNGWNGKAKIMMSSVTACCAADAEWWYAWVLSQHRQH
jgi:hypothetical protein